MSVMNAGERFKALVSAARQIAKERGEVHYTELAVLLSVSPGYAVHVAKAAAYTDNDKFEYRRGWLICVKKDEEKEDEV